MVVQTPIDWERLARQLGAIRAEGGESGGSDLALRALEELVGATEWRGAVDHYVHFKPGFELARSVLGMVHPWAAMERCHEIVGTSQHAEERQIAVELLQVAADKRVLPWVREFLKDSNGCVQQMAAGIVDQLLWSGLATPEDCADLLESMNTHPNAHVQETVAWIRSFLQKRESDAKPSA
jgi:hypothetical protein